MRTLPTCLDQLWECSRGYRLMSMLLGDSPIVARGDGYPARPTSCGQSSLYTLLSLLPPPPFLQGFSFLSAESNSVFIHFLFSYLLFFTQAVGVTILSSSALHSSFLPHFPASLPYRFLTSSRHGKPHLARVLPPCRSHRECL